jgi:hypothetical protein
VTIHTLLVVAGVLLAVWLLALLALQWPRTRRTLLTLDGGGDQAVTSAAVRRPREGPARRSPVLRDAHRPA